MSSPADSKLFQSFRMRDLELSNRVVLAPMTRARSGSDRIPNDLMAEYYAQRASSGLIITEATTVSEQANGWIDSPGIYTEAMRDGWRGVVDAVHQKGGRIFLQLWHMGRASHSSFHPGLPTVAPSAIAINEEYIHTPDGKQPHEVPHALTAQEISATVADYGRAAELAREAGFDGVEVHGANGYLIDQFLQSKSNHREDEYGGSVENRYRFLAEVMEAVLAHWPSERVGVRLSPNGVYNDMGSEDYREQFLYTAGRLSELKPAYLHVMDGLAFGFHELGEPVTLAEARSVFSGPLMGNCGYDREDAAARVDAGEADLISIGRPYLANPDLVERWANDWPLADVPDAEHWWNPTGARGYTDFPAYDMSEEA